MLIYQNMSQIKCLHQALPLHNYQTAYCEISFQFPQSQIHICPFLKEGQNRIPTIIITEVMT